jgi:hypothetical protein
LTFVKKYDIIYYIKEKGGVIMKLIDALELGLDCGLETIEEAIYNIQIHAPSLFIWDDINKEYSELIEEREKLYRHTSFTDESKTIDVLKFLNE